MMIVESQGKDLFPWIGATGRGDMVNTTPIGAIDLNNKKYVIVSAEVFELLLQHAVDTCIHGGG